MSLDFVCGWECRQVAGGAANSPVENHWHAFTNAPTVSTTTVRSGLASAHINPAGAASMYWGETINRPVVVCRVYFRVASFAASGAAIIAFVNANGTAFVRLDETGQLTLDMGAASDVDLDSPISLDTWYRLDLIANSSTGTASLKGRLNGGTEAEGTVSQAAVNFTAARFGTQGTATMDMFFDDLVMGNNVADYPIGAGEVEGIHPNEDGTHSFTAGDFRYDAAGANILTSATDVNTYVDDTDLSSVADFISQRVVRSTGYVEVQFPDPVSTQDPQIVGVVLSMHSSSTNANTAGWKLNDGGTILAVNDVGGDGLSDISNTGVAYIGKCYATKPSSGAWTLAALQALRVRFGYSTDILGEPRWDGLVLEAAFPEAPVESITHYRQPTMIGQAIKRSFSW